MATSSARMHRRTAVPTPAGAAVVQRLRADGNHGYPAADLGNPPVESIFDAHEPRNRGTHRFLENLWGRPALQHGAPTQHNDFVGERLGVGMVMGDKNRWDSERTQERQQLVAQLTVGLGVEREKRFVEQEQAWRAGERAGKCNALLLAGAQIIRHPACQMRDIKILEQRGNVARQCFVARDDVPAIAPTNRNVSFDIQVRKQSETLHDKPDIASLGWERRHVATRD